MRVTYLGEVVALSAALSGCATVGASEGVGGVTGALVGAGVGLAVDPGAKGRGRIKNVAIGSVAGAALGVGGRVVAALLYSVLARGRAIFLSEKPGIAVVINAHLTNTGHVLGKDEKNVVSVC